MSEQWKDWQPLPDARVNWVGALVEDDRSYNELEGPSILDGIVVHEAQSDLSFRRATSLVSNYDEIDQEELDNILAFHATDPLTPWRQALGKRVRVTASHMDVPKGTVGVLVGFDETGAEDGDNSNAVINIKPIPGVSWKLDPDEPTYPNALRPKFHKLPEYVYVHLKHLKRVR